MIRRRHCTTFLYRRMSGGPHYIHEAPSSRSILGIKHLLVQHLVSYWIVNMASVYYDLFDHARIAMATSDHVATPCSSLLHLRCQMSDVRCRKPHIRDGLGASRRHTEHLVSAADQQEGCHPGRAIRAGERLSRVPTLSPSGPRPPTHMPVKSLQIRSQGLPVCGIRFSLILQRLRLHVKRVTRFSTL